MLSTKSLSHTMLVRICSQSPHHPAWQEFHKRFDPYIKMYVQKYWKARVPQHPFDNTIAQETILDLVQDVYLKLIERNQKALRNFKGAEENSFFAYLARIASNIVEEYFRKQSAEKRKNPIVPMDMATEESVLPTSQANSAYPYFKADGEEELLTRITIREISELTEKLLVGPHLQRDKIIFKLHVMEGFSVKQLAQKQDFGLQVSSLESIIRRTRNKITHALRVKSPHWVIRKKAQ